jgi:hypothetical protein
LTLRRNAAEKEEKIKLSWLAYSGLKIEQPSRLFEAFRVPVRVVIFVDEPGAHAFAEIVLGHEKAGNRQVGFINLNQVFVFITAKTLQSGHDSQG